MPDRPPRRPGPEDPRPGPSDADLSQLASHARALADAVEAALPGWVARSVEARCHEAGVAVSAAVEADVAGAAHGCVDDVAPRVRALLDADIDDQTATPLALLRGAVRWPTGVLARAGVPAVRRDEFRERSFPDDVYDLTPSSFADVDPALQDPGLAWGAAKAHVHLARRRAEGRR